MPSNTLVIYLGSGKEGQELRDRLDSHCFKEGLSLSEYIRELIEQHLKMTGPR